MDVSIITQDGVLRESCEAIELQHTEANGTLYAQLSSSVQLEAGDCIGFLCVDGRYRLFEISSRELKEPDGIWDVNGVDKAICELMDEPVVDVRARDITIGVYLTRLLASTRFSIGSLGVNPSGTTTGYYESVWSAMTKAMEAYDVRLVPYYILTSGRITGRRVDVISTEAEDRGRIFELGDDLTGISVNYDDSQIKTALYGRGQGVQIDGGNDGSDPAYGRRLTFSDVIWTKADGDPADKPAGQEWIGDPDALAAYSRDGRHRFGFITFDDETDAEELLTKTWDYLQKIKDPIISITGTVRDTAKAFGYGHTAVALYDSVLVRMVRLIDGSKIKTDIRAQIVDVVRDYVEPEQTKLTIGNAVITAGALVRQLSETIDSYRSRAAIWDRANAFDLNGIMDVMNNQIISTTGHWYTDQDTGAIMLVSADETKAMRLTGAGWQISSGKVGGSWVWRTAATGDGIVADTITAGVLQAQLVKILGTDKFFWDANAISIINPSDSNKIIKIGQYDGTNYGIGFSSDGGQTWTQSMNFDGIIAQSIGALEISADKITSGTLSSARIAANSIAVEKLTGTISNNNWEINLTNGTLTIGNISAANINAGTLSVDRIGAGSIALSKLKASTSSGDGIVTLDGTGMSVSHSGIGTQSKTTINANGLKVYDGSGNLVGGLYVPTGQSVAKMGSGALFNPSYGNFSVQLERFFNGEDMLYYYGLALYRKNVRICGLAAPDSDSVDDGALIGFNDWVISLNDILATAVNWSDYDPSQFVMTGESGGGSGATSHLIYAHGRANVSSSQLRSIDYSDYGFTEIPTVVAQYSQEGGNISGDVGALKIYNKTATGFNAIIGGATTQPDRDIDWIAIGFGTGKSS